MSGLFGPIAKILKPAKKSLYREFNVEAWDDNLVSFYISRDFDELLGFIGIGKQLNWIGDGVDFQLCTIHVVFSCAPSCEKLKFENPQVPFDIPVRYCFDMEASLRDDLDFVTNDNGVTDPSPSPVQGPILSRPFKVTAGSVCAPKLRLDIDSTKPLGDYLTLSNPVLVKTQGWPASYERNPALPRPKGFPHRLTFDTLYFEFY